MNLKWLPLKPRNSYKYPACQYHIYHIYVIIYTINMPVECTLNTNVITVQCILVHRCTPCVCYTWFLWMKIFFYNVKHIHKQFYQFFSSFLYLIEYTAHCNMQHHSTYRGYIMSIALFKVQDATQDIISWKQ